jgi:hypothetical protein
MALHLDSKIITRRIKIVKNKMTSMMKIDSLNRCSKLSLIHLKIKRWILMKDKQFLKKEIHLIIKEAKIT